MKDKIRCFVVVWIGLLLPIVAEARNVSNLHGMIPADVTVSDTGDSNVATRVYHPAADEIVQVDCQDTDGCHVFIGSDNADNGGLIVVRNTSANSVTLIEEDNSANSNLEMHDGSNYTVTGFGQILALYRGDEAQFVELTRWPGDISHDALEDISSDDHHTKTVDTDSHADAEEGGTTEVTNPDAFDFDAGDFDVSLLGDGDAGIGLANVVTKLGQSIDHDTEVTGISSSDHHTRPSAGDGMSESSNTFNVNAKRSVETDLDSLQLVGDVGTPGTGEAYIYDGASRGWGSVNHTNLAGVASGQHHTRPSAGTGLTESSNNFNVDLGTSIQSSEIDAGAVGKSELGSNVVNTNELDTSNFPSDGQIPSYNATADQLTWVNDDSGSGSPGGSDGDLQYNNGGSFDGIAPSDWDGTRLTIGNNEIHADLLMGRIVQAGDPASSGGGWVAFDEITESNISAPNSGESFLYVDDSTGDLKIQINFGGTTKTVTIVDFSAN